MRKLLNICVNEPAFISQLRKELRPKSFPVLLFVCKKSITIHMFYLNKFCNNPFSSTSTMRIGNEQSCRIQMNKPDWGWVPTQLLSQGRPPESILKLVFTMQVIITSRVLLYDILTTTVSIIRQVRSDPSFFFVKKMKQCLWIGMVLLITDLLRFLYKITIQVPLDYGPWV